jgi:hypothetical protein
VNIARRLALLVLALPVLALAQARAPSLADRLPRDTYFYVVWRGASAVQANRATNGVLRLWSDPGMATLRERLEERLLLGPRNRAKLTGLTPEELKTFLPLLENPLVAGYAPRAKPPGEKAKGGAAAAAQEGPPPGAHFFVLDVTGKESLLDQLLVSLRAHGKSTQSRFGTTKIEKLELPDGTVRYFARVGDYFLDADQKELLEDLTTRYGLAARLPSLSETPAYRRALSEIGPGAALEAFAHIPDLGERPPRPGSSFNPGAFFRGLHLERAQVLCAGVSFEPVTTRLRAAVLGSTARGSILDAVGASQSSFLTLKTAPPGASYQVARVDAGALYQNLHSALGAALAPEQLIKIALLEAALQQQLGMAPGDLFKLLGGEFAAIHPEAGAPDHADLYAVTINQAPSVLALLRKTLANAILDERHAGTTDFLSLGGGCASAKPPKDCKWRSTLAVTSGMLVMGRNESAVEAAVTRLDQPAAATLAGDPRFAKARARLPESLSGLLFKDLQGVNWQRLLTPVAKAAAKETGQGPAAPVELPGAKVFSRYLREAVGGWWKDPQGIHFTLYVE